MAAGGFEEGGRCGIHTRDHRGRSTELPLSTSPSNACNRWLTLGGWPKWRRVVFEKRVVDAVHPLGIARAPITALPLPTAPSKADGP